MVIADYQGLADVFLRRSRGEPLTAADRELVQTWMETLDHDRAMFAEVLDSTTDSFFGMPRILRGLEGVDSDVEVRPFTSPSPSVVEVEVRPFTAEEKRKLHPLPPRVVSVEVEVRPFTSPSPSVVEVVPPMTDEQRRVRMLAAMDEQRRVRMLAAMATSGE